MAIPNGFAPKKRFSLMTEDFAAPGINSIGVGDMRGWNAANYQSPAVSNNMALPGMQTHPGTDFGNPTLNYSNFSLGDNKLKIGEDKLPGAEGGWMKNAEFGLGVAKVGLDVYNAMEQSKMNKFMKSYYSDQMDMMKTDFTNAAKGANEALSSREERRLSAQGYAIGSEGMQQGVANTMARWGAKETL